VEWNPNVGWADLQLVKEEDCSLYVNEMEGVPSLRGRGHVLYVAADPSGEPFESAGIVEGMWLERWRSEDDGEWQPVVLGGDETLAEALAHLKNEFDKSPHATLAFFMEWASSSDSDTGNNTDCEKNSETEDGEDEEKTRDVSEGEEKRGDGEMDHGGSETGSSEEDGSGSEAEPSAAGGESSDSQQPRPLGRAMRASSPRPTASD
jgi:hypothetical protein